VYIEYREFNLHGFSEERLLIPRTLQPRLRKAAREYPIVTLTGPRQSGKTTLARSAFAQYAYVSLEDPDQQQFALADPRGFLDQFPRKTILDEVQRAPELFSYLQTRVDENDAAGQFVLTGSQNFLLHQAITQPTARRWLSVLEASFVVFLLRPHHRNFSKRLIKSPKLYFFDSGLLCYLLRIRTPEDLRLRAYRGSIFEGFVIAELMKQYHHLGREPDLFSWRSSGGHEIDLIIDHGSELVPVEIKSGQTVAGDFFKGLDYWRKLTGIADAPAALIHAGPRSFRREGAHVYAWDCL
jgi:predicted AAA+ superfamily ATPase